jgi:hypothetical protein
MALYRALCEVTNRDDAIGSVKTKPLYFDDLRLHKETTTIVLKAVDMENERLACHLREGHPSWKGHPIVRVDDVE